jgi:hypothetical protein
VVTTDAKYAADRTRIYASSVFAEFALESLLTKGKFPA